MKNTSKIEIVESDIHAIIEYIDNLKTLKKIVKEDFNKEGRSEMIIADKIPMLAEEIQKYEKILHDYFDRNAKVIKKNQCYILNDFSIYNTRLKIIKVIQRDNKRFIIDECEFSLYDKNFYCSYKKDTSYSVRTLVNHYYNDKLTEISQEEYDSYVIDFCKGANNINNLFKKYYNENK